MAEERLIDDDKDRKFKIRINEDGEEELVIDGDGGEENDTDLDIFYADDEEEILTPEQTAEREAQKERDERARAEKVDALLAKAREKADGGDYEAALYAVRQAEEIDGGNGEVYFLKLRILTREFTEFLNLEESAEAAEGVKKYSSAQEKEQLETGSAGLKAKIAEQEKKTDLLREENEQKKAERRDVFAKLRSNSLKAVIGTAVPFGVMLVLTIVFSTMIFSNERGTYLIATAVCAGAGAVALICALIALNKFWTAARNVALNEKDTSTKLGREYLENKRELEMLNKIYSSFENDLSR